MGAASAALCGGGGFGGSVGVGVGVGIGGSCSAVDSDSGNGVGGGSPSAARLTREGDTLPAYLGCRTYPTLTLSRVWSSGLSHCSQPRPRRIAPAPRRTPPRCAPASRKLFGRTSIATRLPAARCLARHEFPPPTCIREKGVRLRRAGASQCRLFSERLARAGSSLLMTAIPPLGRDWGTRCWPALRGGPRALEPPVCTAEAPTWALSLHGHVERACLARPKARSTAERRSDRLGLTNDESPREHVRKSQLLLASRTGMDSGSEGRNRKWGRRSSRQGEPYHPLLPSTSLQA